MQGNGLAGAAREVLAVEGDQFGDTGPCIIEQLKKEAIPSSAGSGGIGSVQDGLDFWGREVAQEGLRMPLGRNG
jgi:hypothetical protein